MYARNKDRLDYLSGIEKGWLDDDGAGEAITEGIITRAKELLDAIEAQSIIEPILFPDEDGNVLIEWNLDNGITTIDVEPRTYYLFNLDVTKEGEDRYTQVEGATSLQEVIDFVMEKVGTG